MRRLLLVCLLLGACVHRPPALVTPSAPVSSELLGRLQRNSAAFGTLDGVARVRLDRAGQSVSATQLLLVEKPDRLRLDLLSPFGQPLLQLATDGRQLAALFPADATCYRGEATDRNLQRFTRLPLQLPDLVGLLLYQVPLIAYDSESVEVQGGSSILLLRAAEGGRQELRFDRDLRLVEAAYFLDDVLQLRLRYGDFDGGTPPFPWTMQFEMPIQQTGAFLRFTELRLNPAIPPERFRLAPPDGFEIRELP